MSETKILVADDERELADRLKTQLESLGFPVTGLARNATDAIEQTRRDRPNLVFMDIRMGPPDGIAGANVIWKLYATPVIFITGHEEERQRSLQAGAFGFMVRSVMPADREREHLTAAVKSALYACDARAVQACDECYIGLDCSGQLLSARGSVQSLTGFSPSELVGRNLDEFLATESRPASEELLGRTVSEKRSFGLQLHVMTKSGETIPLEVEYSPVYLNGTAKGISMVARKRLTRSWEEWPGRNRRRLELIERMYAEGLDEAETCELEALQKQADSYVGSLGDVDADRLRELRSIYEALREDEIRERGEQ